MRTLAPLLAALFALSLPLAAQAGDGCPYSKDTAVTASVESPTGHQGHHGDCSEACTDSESATEGGCPCAVNASTTAAAQTGGDASTDSTGAVASND
ncbi:MAG: hypothetical protein QNK04_02165 [Myxococcota bacterium]|nr:hypothetical protein [Myxococcota bacterium]